jgi:hypothetical protein
MQITTATAEDQLEKNPKKQYIFLLLQAHTSSWSTTMQRSNTPRIFPPALFYGLALGLACFVAPQMALADDEIRAGAVLQVPFSLRAGAPSLEFTDIRLGLSCQYADVEEDEITVTRNFTETYQNGTLVDSAYSYTTRENEGNQVVGLEGNLFVEPFNRGNVSAELLGFYGSNAIQGALGAGYSFEDDFFLDAKAMFPYSEIGVRFMNEPEIYGGLKTLGTFNPEKRVHRIDAVPTTINTSTVN